VEHFWDNPVGRHGARLLSGRAGRAGLWLAVAAFVAGIVLQRYWSEVDWHLLARPAAAGRVTVLALLAESVLLWFWFAARGGQLGRRVVREGHLDDYRRSCLSPERIGVGLWLAALRPAGLVLPGSLVLSAVVMQLGSDPVSWSGLLQAHGLLACLTVLGSLLGLAVGIRTRRYTAPVWVALGLMAAPLVALLVLNHLLPRLPQPEACIQATLLPNPAAALAAALEVDLFRFSWLYRTLRVHEYFYVYPPVWQTGLAGIGLTALLFPWLTQRIRVQ